VGRGSYVGSHIRADNRHPCNSFRGPNRAVTGRAATTFCQDCALFWGKSAEAKTAPPVHRTMAGPPPDGGGLLGVRRAKISYR